MTAKPYLTRHDVSHAHHRASKRPVTNIDRYDQDMADYLNDVLALKAKARRVRAGTILETIAVIGVLTGITIGITEPDLLAVALPSTVISFIIGLIGWGMGEDA